MAKKVKSVATTEKVVEQEVVKMTQEYIQEPELDQVEEIDEWEMKDRVYFLKNGLSPLSYKIPSRRIFYFDEEKGYEREMSYTRNQKTPFVDEFQGEARLAHIIFRDGTLTVPKNQQNLQKLLSLYHPSNGVLFQELNAERNATVEVDNIELELEAMNAAVSLDIDMAEAVMRVEIGSKVGIVKLSRDNRTFTWATNGRKLMTVPFDEHPYSALASWFKTDEGMEVLNSIEKRLN